MRRPKQPGPSLFDQDPRPAEITPPPAVPPPDPKTWRRVSRGHFIERIPDSALIRPRTPARAAQDFEAARFGRRLQVGDLYVIPGGDPEDVYQVLSVTPGSALVRQRKGRHYEFSAPDPKNPGEEKAVSFDAPGRAILVSPHSGVTIVGKVGG